MGSWNGDAINIVKRIAKYLIGKEKYGLVYRKDPGGSKIEDARLATSKFVFYGD